MALGKVSVNNLNLSQGAVTEVEKYFLFIGTGAKSPGQVIALNTDSDLHVMLGSPASDLNTQITAARLNGGENWACLAVPLAADSTWETALTKALQQNYSFEAIVICTAVASGAELSAMHDAAIGLNNSLGRRAFVMAASEGIAETMTWSEYLAEQKAITDDLAAPRVMCVPQLHGNDLGVLAGRLANSAVSIADSPMRVATGALLGLGPVPEDKDGVPLDRSVRIELDKSRFSVSQTYTDYPGVYWGDGNLLDAPGSDYQVIEYLRIVDKAARQVRPLLIRRVADRRLNNSPNSMATNKTFFMTPLRAMAKSTTFAGQTFPGEIESPADNAIVLSWKSKTEVEVYISVRPLNCPKVLTANIALDLSTNATE